MESISDIIERKGGYTTVGELSSDSEYRRVLRAVERGEMQKIRHGVYANADALEQNERFLRSLSFVPIISQISMLSMMMKPSEFSF